MIFLGSDDAAAACLAALCDARLVTAAFTPAPKVRSRRGAAEATPVADVARARGLRLVETDDVNAGPAVAAIREEAPRLLIVVSFGQFLRRPVRESAPLGGINLHYSLLPRWRGAAPVQRAIEAGDAETGASVQRVSSRLDEGDVLGEARVPIAPGDDTATLRAKLTAAGAPLLVSVARRLAAGEFVAGREQDDAHATWARPVAKEEGDLDPATTDAALCERRVRAFEPWPRCRVRIACADGREETLVVRAARAEPGAAAPGTVVAAGPDGIRIACATGVLVVTRVQRPGGKDMDARAFLNGFRVVAGDRAVQPA
ncbi:MAG: Methionyl-tRNA formyltransferase [Planctomycetes bacterium]|nr:Methionyl-tRNA formyltransferase [Planctomycetota bacterium]